MSLNDSVGKSKDQGPLLTVLDSSSTRFTSLLCVVMAFSFPFFFFGGVGGGLGCVRAATNTETHPWIHAGTLRMHAPALEIAEGIS